MGEPLGILQLSDLLVTSADAAQVAEYLGRELRKHHEMRVDYVVLAGNLVKDLKAYPELHLVLDELLDKLRDHVPEYRKVRLFIAPGKSDVTDAAGKLDFLPFRRFHDKFFAEEIAKNYIHAFEPGKPIIRRCRNLNWVGALWWKGRDSRDRAGLSGARRLAEAVDAAVDEASYEYVRCTPSILVSSERPPARQRPEADSLAQGPPPQSFQGRSSSVRCGPGYSSELRTIHGGIHERGNGAALA
jgi:hypothetical protein